MTERPAGAGDLTADHLAVLEACEEGVAWFAETFGEEAASLEDLVETLAGGPHADFLAWGFYRLPQLRQQVSPSFLHSLMGPRYPELAALADGLEAFSWLEPDGISDHQITRKVNTHLRRLGAFGFIPSLAIIPVVRRPLEGAWSSVVTALAAFDQESTQFPPLAWSLLWGAAASAAGRATWDDALPEARLAATHVSRMLDSAELPVGVLDETFSAALEVGRRVRDATALGDEQAGLMRQTETGIGDPVFGAVFSRSQDHFAALVPSHLWRVTCSAMTEALGTSTEGEVEDNAVFWASSTVGALAQDHVMQEALWLLTGSPQPSPWSPLVDLWRHGLWPVGLVGNAFVVVDPSL